jgi:hypothetical protein
MGEDALAIGDGRTRGQARGDVPSLVWDFLPHRSIPHDLSVAPVHREDGELLPMSNRIFIVTAGAPL